MPIPGVGGGFAQSTDDRALTGVRAPEDILAEADTLLTVLAFVDVRFIPADNGIGGCDSLSSSRDGDTRLTMLLDACLFIIGRVIRPPRAGLALPGVIDLEFWPESVGVSGGPGMAFNKTGSSSAVACSNSAN
jgi:hypothetical protein